MRTIGVGEQSQVEEGGNPSIVLSVLTSVERDSAITQRKLAHDLGIALGLANAYLRRCVRKGLVKMRQVPINRYAYYLTPQGLAEKAGSRPNTLLCRSISFAVHVTTARLCFSSVRHEAGIRWLSTVRVSLPRSRF
jgi:DNA-binding MarR family transcriptional regulator